MTSQPWRHEDGGPRRTQVTSGALDAAGSRLELTTRFVPGLTMVVHGLGGELYLLRHTAGDEATAVVEQIDPITLEPLQASPALRGGPAWPGGIGVADDGSVHVVFGDHAHRLDRELRVLACRQLPRHRPYNSFVPLPDGHIATKDFAGSRPGAPVPPDAREPAELLVLDPETLEVVARATMQEPSIARLSADGNDVYVVGDTSLLRARWDGRSLGVDREFAATYRALDGQTYGWDCVLAAGAAWFLDDGDGSEAYDGTLRGHGRSTAPLHLVRVRLDTAEVDLAEVCGRPGGLVANPPVVDVRRGVVVGYDSGNGVMAGFDLDSLDVVWRHDQDHGGHLLLYEESGELVTGDHADVVVLDAATGHELARADTGSGIQSVTFPAPGTGRDLYFGSFLTLSRVAVVPPPGDGLGR